MSVTCLITALPSEARPLITHFGMRSFAHPHLKMHASNTMVLLQCGVGKLNAAVATATMLNSCPTVSSIINVGIAGSDQPLGETLIAHHVQDEASAQQWFPHLPSVRKLPKLTSVRVLSVDTPANDYKQHTAFDMEAAGIFAAATKVLDLAFIHSLKVVSDNKQINIEAITAESVHASIQCAIPAIEQLRDALPFDALPSTATTDALAEAVQARIHYTETEKHALVQLLNRHRALLKTLPSETELVQLESAKAIRHQLTKTIDQAHVEY